MIPVSSVKVNIVFEILYLKIELEKIEQRKCRIYPGNIREIIFDISQLADKMYSNVRCIFDDGDKYLKAERINFIKGIEPEKLKLARIKTKKIAQRKRGKPFSVGLQLGTGSRQKLNINLAGNINMKNLSFNFGGYHSEYLTNDFNSFRVSGNWKPSRYFSFGVGTMAFIGSDKIRYTSMLRTVITEMEMLTLIQKK